MGDVALVKLLTEKGNADVNAKTIEEEGSESVLHYAAQEGQLEVIQFLLDNLHTPDVTTTATTITATPATQPSPSPIPAVISKKVIVTPIQHQQRRALTVAAPTPTIG